MGSCHSTTDAHSRNYAVPVNNGSPQVLVDDPPQPSVWQHGFEDYEGPDLVEPLFPITKGNPITYGEISPLQLPLCPQNGITEAVVHAAFKAWNGQNDFAQASKGVGVGIAKHPNYDMRGTGMTSGVWWGDDQASAWLNFAARHLLHHSKDAEMVILRMIGGMDVDDRTFKALQVLVQESVAEYAPLLVGYRTKNKLVKKLKGIDIAQNPNVKPLNQDSVVPFLGATCRNMISMQRSSQMTDGLNDAARAPYALYSFSNPLLAAYEGDFNGFQEPDYLSATYETHIRYMLLLLAEYIDPYFDIACANLGTKTNSPQRKVAVKSIDRVLGKARFDHATGPHPRSGQNLDMNRKAVCSKTAREQVEVWSDVQKAFPAKKTVRVKNNFQKSDAETLAMGGMQQILINVVAEAKNSPGAAITYLEMVNSREFKAIGRSRIEFNSSDNSDWRHRSGYGDAFNLLTELAKTVKEVGDAPVRAIAEIQLHLAFYLKARKKTHVWFKITRAANVEALRGDCSNHFPFSVNDCAD